MMTLIKQKLVDIENIKHWWVFSDTHRFLWLMKQKYWHFAFNTGTLCFTQPPDAISQPPDATFSTSWCHFFNFSGMSILWIGSASMGFSKSLVFDSWFGKTHTSTSSSQDWPNVNYKIESSIQKGVFPVKLSSLTTKSRAVYKWVYFQ